MMRLFRFSLATLGIVLMAMGSAQASHTLGYLFDDAPGSSTAVADGGSAGSAPALNIVGPAVIGADGSGVSGKPGDRALDNRAANGMGGTTNSSGGRGTHAADFEAIDGLLKFTIAGWFKTDGAAPLGGNAVLYANRSGVAGVSLHGDPNTPGNLVLAVDNGSNSSTGFGATQDWVNFAVTYDGTVLQPGPNVFFYAGSKTTPLALVGSGTNTNGSGNDPASNETAPLSLGSRVLFGAVDADPFDGLLDNFRVWDEVVPLSALEGIRVNDAGVPEPSTLMLVAMSVVPMLARRRCRI
ncbi:LamG domain-containing protein [Bythopirellula polymerisocia]|uniref:LamG-like jellyroll fold domain-containing protein n=1 Tax=Bythopirellula polymerisocia TaxID=2528003 RepID=A0A5C6D595_9BACT|nr:LamG domain-containing protein [Bythopirellula polymerisocia]TWU30069.1 hypothetical protein Pla144_08550 [Bythopirellula polymerisocia]